MSVLKECCLGQKVGHFCFRVSLLWLKVRLFFYLKCGPKEGKKVTLVMGVGEIGAGLWWAFKVFENYHF